MAFGDVGGAVTELVITCSTKSEGNVSIEKGDAVCITGNYEVDNDYKLFRPLFGQSLASTDENAKAIPVRVRGICVFSYTGQYVPVVDGISGVKMSDVPGRVMVFLNDKHKGKGINVKVVEGKKEVHVLI